MELSSRLTPFFLSLCYGLASSISVILSSLIEGTLLTNNIIVLNEKIVTQYSYINNYSTILNFIFLNPLGIYLLLKAEIGYKKSFIYFRSAKNHPVHHKGGNIVLAVIVGCSLMYFYFDGFVGGNFFSAAFEPDENGRASVSITGAFIFFWTALYMSFLFYSSMQYGRYIVFIRKLEVKNFGLSLTTKVHPSITIAILPCVQVMYGLTTLFLVMLIFIVRDYYQFEIHESRRVWLFAPYLLVGISSTLPFYHLHKIMTKQKAEIIDRSAQEVERLFLNKAFGTNWNTVKLENILEAADMMDKTYKLCSKLKVWPVQLKTLTMPNISFAVSLLTLIYKVFSMLPSSQAV